MKPRKTREREIADKALQLLKDVMADVTILGDGRGGHHRLFTAQTQLWEVEKLLRELDPDKPQPKEVPPAINGTKVLALSYKPDRKLFE